MLTQALCNKQPQQQSCGNVEQYDLIVSHTVGIILLSCLGKLFCTTVVAMCEAPAGSISEVGSYIAGFLEIKQISHLCQPRTLTSYAQTCACWLCVRSVSPLKLQVSVER